MTCIVGVEHAGGVTIGGDSAGVSGWSLTIRADEKVFTRSGYVLGFTSSFRMGQLLRYAAELPTPPAHGIDGFMATRFIDAVREALKTGGYTKITNSQEESGTFLVGVSGRLYAVYSDHQLSRAVSGYNAVGCGADIAVGSLHSTAALRLPPEKRVRMALEAAAALSAGVAGPMRLKTLKRAAE